MNQAVLVPQIKSVTVEEWALQVWLINTGHDQVWDDSVERVGVEFGLSSMYTPTVV